MIRPRPWLWNRETMTPLPIVVKKVTPASPLMRWGRDLQFLSDEADEQTLIDGNGTQVMMEWEMPYMQR